MLEMDKQEEHNIRYNSSQTDSITHDERVLQAIASSGLIKGKFLFVASPEGARGIVQEVCDDQMWDFFHNLSD